MVAASVKPYRLQRKTTLFKGGFLLNKPIDKEVIETWYEFFLDIPEKVLKDSIKDLAK